MVMYYPDENYEGDSVFTDDDFLAEEIAAFAQRNGCSTIGAVLAPSDSRKIACMQRKCSLLEEHTILNLGNDKVYIQSALNVDTPEKKAQETFSLRNTGDFFRKIVVLDGSRRLWSDEDGVMYVGVIPFLLEDIVAEIIS